MELLGGVLISLSQDIEPIVGYTTESVTHGQCDARHTVTTTDPLSYIQWCYKNVTSVGIK